MLTLARNVKDFVFLSASFLFAALCSASEAIAFSEAMEAS
jgi:hypothetical protein